MTDRSDESRGTSRKDPNLRVNCIHAVVMPRWDNEADTGIMERVTGYRCEGCGSDLTIEQGSDAIRKGTVVLGT